MRTCDTVLRIAPTDSANSFVSFITVVEPPCLLDVNI